VTIGIDETLSPKLASADQIDAGADAVDARRRGVAELDRALLYDCDVDRITPPDSALLILSGGGPARIRAGHHLDGRA
jgi:hypothetical protein